MLATARNLPLMTRRSYRRGQQDSKLLRLLLRTEQEHSATQRPSMSVVGGEVVVVDPDPGNTTAQKGSIPGGTGWLSELDVEAEVGHLPGPMIWRLPSTFGFPRAVTGKGAG